jgi:hypothetical protein
LQGTYVNPYALCGLKSDKSLSRSQGVEQFIKAGLSMNPGR